MRMNLINRIKELKLIDLIETILSGIVLIIIIHYLVINFEKYYMISYFMLPFVLRFISIGIENKRKENKRIFRFISFTIIFYFIIVFILTLLIPDFNNFFITTDKFLFPFFYYKKVEFSFWIVVFWMLSGIIIKNKILSLSLSIAFLVMWLLVYNLC